MNKFLHPVFQCVFRENVNRTVRTGWVNNNGIKILAHLEITGTIIYIQN